MKNVLLKYWIYKNLFKDWLLIGLPKHIKWDYAIDLIDGTDPTFYKIYNLILEEIEALDDYLDEMLEKGYIWPLISAVGYPIMFVKKKNGKLCLVVNYCRLNAITKKD
jgi:hypothetical protein